MTHTPPNITNLTLTQGFFLDYFGTGISSAWTLTIEECFYIIFPLIILTLIPAQRLSRILLVLLIWIVGFLILGIVLMTWARQSGIYLQAGFLGRPEQNPLYPFSYTIFGYIFDFAVGIFFALPYLKGIRWKAWQATLLAIISIGGILYCMETIDAHNGGLTLDRLTVYVIAFFSGTLILALTHEGTLLSRFTSWEGFVYWGRISFGLYLIQKTALIDFMRAWDLVPFYLGANIMCAVFYQFVEEPARKAVMRLKFHRVRAPEISAVQNT